MSKNLEKFKRLYDFEIETDFKYHKDLKDRYFKLLEEAPKTGFYPFVLVLSENLFEIFKIVLDGYNLKLTKKNLLKYSETVLEEYKKIDVYDLFENLENEFKIEIKKLEMAKKWNKNFEVPIIDEDRSEFEFISIFNENYDSSSDSLDKRKVLPDTIIVKIPLTKPYEVFAYFPVREHNYAPYISEMIAISKYWFNKYFAFPAAINCTELDYFVGKPVSEDMEVKKLAIEHLLFAFPMALDGYTPKEIAKAFKNNVQWYFYWY